MNREPLPPAPYQPQATVISIVPSSDGDIILSANEKEGADEKKVFPEATYECLRCGTRVSGAELAKLPEPTCANCGYRLFRKVRGQMVKTLKGE
jgi:DNA-directed RNA polymerase subunit RPC12/RpoP